MLGSFAPTRWPRPGHTRDSRRDPWRAALAAVAKWPHAWWWLVIHLCNGGAWEASGQRQEAWEASGQGQETRPRAEPVGAARPELAERPWGSARTHRLAPVHH